MKKNPNAIPSTRTVNTIVDSKIAVSKKTVRHSFVLKRRFYHIHR